MLDRLPIQKYPDLGASTVELSILMPCLNEAETLGICIEKAQRYLNQNDVAGEVIVADNGSTDGSQEIAQSMGAAGNSPGVSHRWLWTDKCTRILKTSCHLNRCQRRCGARGRAKSGARW